MKYYCGYFPIYFIPLESLIHETLPWMYEQQNTWLRSRVCDILENCFHLVSQSYPLRYGFLASWILFFFFFCLVEHSRFNFQQMSIYHTTLIISIAYQTILITLELVTSESNYLLYSWRSKTKNSLWVERNAGKWVTWQVPWSRFRDEASCGIFARNREEKTTLTSLPVLLFIATG